MRGRLLISVLVILVLPVLHPTSVFGAYAKINNAKAKQKYCEGMVALSQCDLRGAAESFRTALKLKPSSQSAAEMLGTVTSLAKRQTSRAAQPSGASLESDTAACGWLDDCDSTTCWRPVPGEEAGLEAHDGKLVVTSPPPRDWSRAYADVHLDLDRFPILAFKVDHISPGCWFEIYVQKLGDPPQQIKQISGSADPGIFMVDLPAATRLTGDTTMRLKVVTAGKVGGSVTYDWFCVTDDQGSYFLSWDSSIPRMTALGGYYGEEGELLAGSVPGSDNLAWSDPACTRRIGNFDVWYDHGSNTNVLAIRGQGWHGSLATEMLEGLHPELLSTACHPAVLRYQDQSGRGILIVSQLSIGDFITTVRSYTKNPRVLRISVWARLTAPASLGRLTNRFWFADKDGRMGRSTETRYLLEQRHSSTPMAFLSEAKLAGCTLLFYEDYGTMGGYLDSQQVGVGGTVKGNGRNFGAFIPWSKEKEVTSVTSLCLSDCFISCRPGTTATSTEASQRMVSQVRDIYDLIEHPQTDYTDWLSVVEKELEDIETGPCTARIGKHRYLRSYVNTGTGGAELLTQLDVLVPLRQLEKSSERPKCALSSDLEDNLPTFYKDVYSQVMNGYPDDAGPCDTGYFLTEMIGLARLAELGDDQAKELLMRSVPAAMELATNCQYKFPILYDCATKKPGLGSQPDAAGQYAYLMLQVHRITGEARYLEEAKRSIEIVLSQTPGGHSYKAECMALACATAARLYRITGDRSYLERSYIPLSSLLQACWIVNYKHGLNKGYRTFMGIGGFDYIAMMELHQSWLALREYYLLLYDELTPDARALIGEVLKYNLTVGRYTLPPFLPAGTVADVGYWKLQNDPSLHIPVEDLNEGWRKAGSIGQEIYGAGGPITFAAFAYQDFRDQGFSLYSEYPIRECEPSGNGKSLDLILTGADTYEGLVAVRLSDNTKPRQFQLTDERGKLQPLAKIDDRTYGLRVPGGKRYRLMWR